MVVHAKSLAFRLFDSTRDPRLDEADNVGDLGTFLSTEERAGEDVVHGGGEGDVGKGDSLTDEEGEVEEVGVDGRETVPHTLLENALEGLRGQRGCLVIQRTITSSRFSSRG